MEHPTRSMLEHISHHLGSAVGIKVQVGALDPYTIKKYPAIIMFPANSRSEDAQNTTHAIELLYTAKNIDTTSLLHQRDMIIEHLYNLPVSTYQIGQIDIEFYEGTMVDSPVSVIAFTLEVEQEVC